MFEVGDRVTVIDGEEVYDSYFDWVHENAPNYEPNWKKWYEPQNGDVCEVVAVANHKEAEDIIYGVLNEKQEFFAMSANGLRKL